METKNANRGRQTKSGVSKHGRAAKIAPAPPVQAEQAVYCPSRLKPIKKSRADRLRRAIRASELTPARICRKARITKYSFGRFMDGYNLPLPVLQTLADVLGVQIERGGPPPNKGRTFPGEPLTMDEIRRLIAACSKRGLSGRRNESLIVTMYRCGLRLGETLALDPKDVDFEAGSIRVLRGKGGKSRVVGADQVTLATLRTWLVCREAYGIDGKSPIYCTLKGGPLHQEYVRQALRRLADRAKPPILKRIHPHGLRHSAASDMANEGWNTYELQAQLGHAHLATTARYIASINPHQLIEKGRNRLSRL